MSESNSSSAQKHLLVNESLVCYFDEPCTEHWLPELASLSSTVYQTTTFVSKMTQVGWHRSRAWGVDFPCNCDYEGARELDPTQKFIIIHSMSKKSQELRSYFLEMFSDKKRKRLELLYLV